jgi:uncharacterized protein (DUF305 family)
MKTNQTFIPGMLAIAFLSSLSTALPQDRMQVTSNPAFAQSMAASMEVMDKGMVTAAMTGDPDHDFTTMMIPHHQGAIDMAKAVLLHGKDPVIRRLAQEIIVTQQQ